MIKIVYAVLLGVILAFFIGLGIEAFYPTEKYPETPVEIQYGKADGGNLSADQRKVQEDFDLKVKDYQNRNKNHARNVSLIAIAGSIICMALSLAVLNKKDVFADGFLIGSLLTLIYGIMRGFESDDSKFRFIVVAIGLASALILGYFKFLRLKDETKK